MSLLKTAKQRALFEKWNKKLEKYDDCNAEDFSHNPDYAPLKDWHSFKFRNLSKDKYEEVQLYYSRARDLLNTYKFKTRWHKRIWELHSEGLSGEQISVKLDRRYGRIRVNQIIKIIRKDTKIDEC